jgi:hypothetical protein
MAMKELLGEEGYRRLQQHDRTAYGRELVQGLVGAATVAGVPFAAQQAEQLLRVVIEAGERPGQGFGLSPVDWARAEQNAAKFLSAEQMKFLATTEPDGVRGAGWRYLMQMNLLIAEAKKKDRASAGAAVGDASGKGGGG